jgi:hypothetical protein
MRQKVARRNTAFALLQGIQNANNFLMVLASPAKVAGAQQQLCS